MNAAEALAKYAIPPELLDAAGVRHATDCEVRELLGVHGRAGLDLSGIVFLYRDPYDGRTVGHRVRLDASVEGQRYLSEQGCRTLFFPPDCGSELTDTSIPVVIVESEKSVLALTALAQRCARKILPIAVGGVWGWKRRNGTATKPDGSREPVTGPSPSLDSIAWKGRKTIIVFDSNIAGRRDLERARLALAQELTKRGAQVLIGSTPKQRGANGPDDVIALLGDNAALDLLDRAALFAQARPTSQCHTGFVLIPLSNLLSRPDVPVEYVWESRLVAGTVSVLVSKPKVGKSTFARNLTLAVARGTDYLGLKTKKGDCIYLALEEREEDVRNDFRAMGADGSESICVHAASAPAEGIAALCDLVRQRRPVLVVIDPLFRIARIRDEKAYAETYAALGPLIDVARETGTHIVLVHHAGKGKKADPVDSPLGSTGIGGVGCALIVLKRRESCRTIQTVQRIGPEMAETILAFDTESRALSLGPEKSEADGQVLSEEILEYLADADIPKDEDEIMRSVEGKTGPKRKALRRLVKQGAVVREGSGKKGHPYQYSFSRSQNMPGTRERESDIGLTTPANTDDILVPEPSKTSVLVPAEPSLEEGEL